jgi:hypothetical protein
MNINYGGTKKTLDKDRETALERIDVKNPVDKKRVAAVNDLVDAFLADKSIDDSVSVSVTAVTSTNAMSVNITLNQATFVPPVPPETINEQSKPLTKKAEKDKQEANAKTVTKKVERISAEDATDGTVGEANRLAKEAAKNKSGSIMQTYRPAKLGRPRGKSIVAERAWQPTVWEPIYEAIVAESIIGTTNKALAEKYKYTETQISNILNTNKAREIKRDAIALIKANSEAILNGKMGESVDRAVHMVHDVLHDEVLRKNHPFSIFSASMQVLKGLGRLQGDGPVINNNTVNVQPGSNAVINLGEEQQEIFLRGLKKANEALEKHKDMSSDSIR